MFSSLHTHIRSLRRCALFALATLLALPAAATAADTNAAPLRVGITLHPYYSWVSNIVQGTDVVVQPVLPGDVDAGNYQPAPEDIRKLAELDAIVVNGLGHDDFIRGMIDASGNRELRIIEVNRGTPLISNFRDQSPNSHTFISFTNAIQQSYLIARTLGELRPQFAATFRRNARTYAARLRAIKTTAAAKLVDPKYHRVVTVHDGYSYLLQEFGIEVAGVVEPAHGLIPSAAELQGTIGILRSEKVHVLFSEERFPQALLQVVRDASDARIYILSHVATGAYTADKFETEMARNADTLVAALNGE
jgi:zinc transport system substrate-binding protein